MTKLLSVCLVALTVWAATSLAAGSRRPVPHRQRSTAFLAAHVNAVLGKKCLPPYGFGTRLQWIRRHRLAHARARGVCVLPIPHWRDWLCIHSHEGAWNDAGDPYWGGLQMDRGFMQTYAPGALLKRGWANVWTPREQMLVAERAYASGRGFGPWPVTARACGLL